MQYGEFSPIAEKCIIFQARLREDLEKLEIQLMKRLTQEAEARAKKTQINEIQELWKLDLKPSTAPETLRMCALIADLDRLEKPPLAHRTMSNTKEPSVEDLAEKYKTSIERIHVLAEAVKGRQLLAKLEGMKESAVQTLANAVE